MEKTSPWIRASNLSCDSSFQADVKKLGIELRLNKITNRRTDTINKCKPNQDDGISLLYIVRNRLLVLVNTQIRCTRRKRNIVLSTCNFLIAVTFLQLYDVWKAATIRTLVLHKMSPYFHGPFGLRSIILFKPFTEYVHGCSRLWE